MKGGIEKRRAGFWWELLFSVVVFSLLLWPFVAETVEIRDYDNGIGMEEKTPDSRVGLSRDRDERLRLAESF